MPSGRGKKEYLHLLQGVTKVVMSPCSSYSSLHFNFFSNLSFIRGVTCTELPEQNRVQASFARAGQSSHRGTSGKSNFEKSV